MLKFGNILPDSFFLRLLFHEKLGYKLNLKNPQTYNEKLQWLKLHDRKPIYTVMVDKYEAKNYVANIIGNDFIIPTLGVWDRFDDIDFNELPNQFVLKTTHDSGSVVICKDRENFNINQAKKKLETSLKTDFYLLGREWPYKNVKRRIIAEKYMEDKRTHNDLLDYKFMCFNGSFRCSFVCSDRNSTDGLKVTFYDIEWEKMPFHRHYPSADYDIPRPSSYTEMIRLAEKLSRDIPFLRVDFYEINNHPYFGELTMYPGSGFEEFVPVEWDYILGSWIKLPK